MKALLKSSLFLLVTISFGSCENKKAEDNLSNYMNMYSGIIVENQNLYDTYVTLNKDSTADVTYVLRNTDTWHLKTTQYQWSYKDSIFNIKNDSNELNFKTRPDYTLNLLVTDVKTKQDIIFSKKKRLTIKNFVGVYYLGGKYQDSYKQSLIIRKKSNNKAEVKIVQVGDGGKGCDFIGEGHIVNNQIEVSLKTINPELKATLTIRHLDTGEGVNVLSSDFEDRYDLMYFCGGGGSLIGSYLKD